MPQETKAVYEFGPFRLLVEERLLLRDGQPLPLAPKALEILLVLVENHGHVVLKDTLMSRVWPDTFVQEDNISYNISTVRRTLGDSSNGERYIATVPRRGYRFAAPVNSMDAAPEAAVHEPLQQPAVSSVPGRLREDHPEAALPQPPKAGPEPYRTGPVAGRLSFAKVVPLVVTLAVALGAACLYFYIHHRVSQPLTAQDTIVLADFTNTTGDSVFDGTLRQGLSAQLEQSPFLNLLSDARIAQTLALMAEPKDARLTPERAREVCQRTASAATLEGSIAALGSQYVIGLKAVNCRTGDLLGEAQVMANAKEQVLNALGTAAAKVRQKMGESLASVEKYDTPPENVTTPSLEALQAYSLGYREQMVKNDPAAAIPFFQRAIRLDPKFAMAWAELATSQSNLGEGGQSVESARKAYELGDRVSEREKFQIASVYDGDSPGNLETSRKLYELWAATYPSDGIPLDNLGTFYAIQGDYSKSLAARQEALKLDPHSGLAYANLVASYLFLNRLEEAKATAQEARTHNLDSPLLHYILYFVAFQQRDSAGMEREAAGLMGKAGYEDYMLYSESDTFAYGGQLVRSRELIGRAVDSALRTDEKETAAGYKAGAALREALVGSIRLARQQAQAALQLSHGPDVEVTAAVALGLTGDSAQARRLADDLSRRFPQYTIMQSQNVPMIRAAAILGSSKASKDAAKAIETLAITAPYELGNGTLPLYPVYLRGQAYLETRQGAAAAAEFQKVLDHPGVVTNDPIGALAHLGLGRAYAIEANVGLARPPARTVHPQVASQQPEALAKARAAYQDFFALWKDADPGIPILKQARAEYAELK